MIETRVFCDFCNQPIPSERKDDVENVMMHTTKVWNTKKLFPCLCENCATKLDKALRKIQTDMVLKEHYTNCYAWLNNKRKEELGTKG